MINHARTLLLNRRPYHTDLLPPGEEVIESGFSPTDLRGAIFQIHELLMPQLLSRDEANFRAACYMQLLHAPDFNQYAIKFDDRITYDTASRYYMHEISAGRLDYVFDGTRIYDTMVNAIIGPRLTRMFTPIAGYEHDLEVFRYGWFSGDNEYMKLTAGVLAITYQLEQERLNAGTI